MKKIAVFFPGIGYHCDKPLLYYTKKIACNNGYEIAEVAYGGFPDGVKGSPEKMMESYRIAMSQTEDILKSINWDKYDDILFVSKSVGTAVACSYADNHSLHTRNIYFTPVEQTLDIIKNDGIIFYGLKDPWINVKNVSEKVKTLSCMAYSIEDANHSLETGDVDNDISIMSYVMNLVKKYI